MPAEVRDPPPLFRHHVRRPRLTRLLDETSAQAIVVVAPAGYGKTTLAAEWAQERDGVAWYQATTASADVSAFSLGIGIAIREILPGAGARLEQRTRIPAAPDTAARALAEVLAPDLAAWPPDARLVIDDYHLVMGSRFVERFVDRLLTLSPLRVLALSRQRPGWASARRILYGELLELTMSELAMDRDETASVLAFRGDEQASHLARAAGGWPALIGLAALAPPHAVPAGRLREKLYQYFADEVLRGEEPAIQRFLLCASVLATLTRETCEEIAAGADVASLLDHLREKGIVQAEGEALRFHPLLREFLQARLAAEDPGEAATLRASALAAARRRRSWSDAFTVAVEGGDLRAAAEVLGEAAPELLANGRIETVLGWLDRCGAAALAVPSAELARADALIRLGRFVEAEARARDVALRLEEGHFLGSRAWYLCGLASALVSDYEAALEAHARAAVAAKTATDGVNAYWGCFLAAHAQRLPDSHRYLAAAEGLETVDVN
ncbi:MAG: hypothetical protein ICV74_03275, partial [Thermoleophilia bacterium]|nr:hypothetical protein [Thermoleophilia bacterium]